MRRPAAPTEPPPDHARAAQMVDRFVARFEESYRPLAHYAALPLALTPELVHYLRQQFLPDTPWVAEVDLLLSELCREAGYETYLMDSAVRAYGISRLRASGGAAQAARLLLNYALQTRREPNFNLYEFQAQRWTALAYLDDGRATAAQEIARAYSGGMAASGAGGGAAAEFLWLSRLVQELAPEFARYPDLVAYAQTVTELLRTPERVSPEQAARTYRVDGRPLPSLTPLTPPHPSPESGAGDNPTPARDSGAGDNPTPAPDSGEDNKPTPAPDSGEDNKPTSPPAPDSGDDNKPTNPPAPNLGEGPGVGSTWREPRTGMEFVWIPAGRFMMGSPKNEKDRYEDEGPQHEVVFKEGFWMGKYPVTQAEWQTIMGNNPSRFKGARRPVEQVSWDDCQEFLRKLNANPPQSPLNHPPQSPLNQGGSQGGWVFRLPSEAEWEYACRAGTRTAYSFGDDPAHLGDYAWYWKNSGGETHPVGERLPNAWGLHNMHGNVWEWCADSWHDNYNGAPTDGSVWGNLSDKKANVLRGGSWSNLTASCRSARRGNISPVNRYDYLGVRVLARTH